jgi:hypothetical protein
VNFVNPNVLSSLSSFKRVFQGPITAGRDKEATPAEAALAAQRSEELSRLTAAFILRRTSRILDAFLPPKSACFAAGIGCDVLVRFGGQPRLYWIQHHHSVCSLFAHLPIFHL